MITYDYIQDPGHGWVKVEKAELKRLGIEKDISSFSYENGKFAYLEEDLDAGIFIEAKQKNGEDFKANPIHVEKTAIRNYNSYMA